MDILWAILSSRLATDNTTLTQDEYLRFNESVYSALVPQDEEVGPPQDSNEEAQAAALWDWKRDTAESRGVMFRQGFSDSMFEVAHVWTEGMLGADLPWHTPFLPMTYHPCSYLPTTVVSKVRTRMRTLPSCGELQPPFSVA